MLEVLGTVLIGLGAGVLSGVFGIGGGIVMIPAVRILLGVPALIAVGTPLVAIIPGALTSSTTLVRNRLADVRTGVTAGLAGALSAPLGALASEYVGGPIVLLITASLLLYFSVTTVRAALAERPPVDEQGSADASVPVASAGDSAAAEDAKPSLVRPLVIGAVTGLASGLLGLGGGFMLVPLFSRVLGFSQRKASATSLVSVAILSVPGLLTHAALGHVNWRIGAALIVGVIPGAWMGARVVLRSKERTLRFAFAAMLAVAAVWLGCGELGIV